MRGIVPRERRCREDAECGLRFIRTARFSLPRARDEWRMFERVAPRLPRFTAVTLLRDSTEEPRPVLRVPFDQRINLKRMAITARMTISPRLSQRAFTRFRVSPARPASRATPIPAKAASAG